MDIKLTPKRKKILAVLQATHGALSASDIHQKLSDVDLVTIYRNLDLFVKAKLIKPVHLGGGESLYEFQHQPHHHALCTDCNTVIHFTAPDEKIKKLLGLKNFEVSELELTVKGTCKHKQA